MAGGDTSFESFLQDEVERFRGVYYPVRSGLLRRLLTFRVRPSRLHPNPEDEFCDPKIGPNREIMSGYMRDYRIAMADPNKARFLYTHIREPIIVQRIKPDGYLILNGHHRWGAAHQMGYKRLKVDVVNLTLDADIERILAASPRSRRVALDLDEVLLRQDGDQDAEPALRFPMNRLYPERLRKGLRGLFYYLSTKGYDVWVYTAQFYSHDYLKKLFDHNHARVTGVITGIARGPAGTEAGYKSIKRMLESKYEETLHIDNDMVVRVDHKTGRYDYIEIGGTRDEWAQGVIDAVEGIVKKR